MLSPRWRKVVRDLWNNRGRSALVIVSIAIGVFAFGGLFTARELALTNLDTQFATSDPSDVTFILPPFDDELVRWFRRQDRVMRAQPVAYYTAQITINGRRFNLDLFGYDDFENIRVNRLQPESGSYPPGDNELLIERSFMPRINVPLGTPVTVEFNGDKTYDLTLVGTVFDVNSVSGNVMSQVRGYVNLHTLHHLDLPARFNEIEVDVERAPASFLGLDDGAQSMDAIADDLREALRARGIYERGLIVNQNGTHWAADVLKGLSFIFVVVGFASLFLSAFLIVNIVSGLLAQQKRQIGVMKVVGATRGQIARLYLVMTAVYGVIAFIIALPGSVVFAQRLAAFVGWQLNFNIQVASIPPAIIALEAAVAILIPTLSALVPILNATRITPAAALRESEAVLTTDLLARLLARLRGLPRPIILGLRNTFRRKLRLAITIVSLAVAGTFFISIINVRGGLQVFIGDMLRMMNYDIAFVLDGSYDRQGVERRAAQIDGVASIEGWLAASVQRERADGTYSDTLTLFGLDERSRFVDPLMTAGDWLSPPFRGIHKHVVVSRGLVLEEAVGVGDTLTLKYGNRSDDFLIVGITEFSPYLYAVYAYYDTVAEFTRRPNAITNLYVDTTVSEHADLVGIANAISAHLEDRDIKIRRYTLSYDTRQDMGGSFDVVIRVLLGMAVLTALVAGLGLAGTMSLNVMERTREIGVMRAIGAGSNDIRRIVLVEGLTAGLLGFVLSLPLVPTVSVLLGNVLGQVMLKQNLPYAPTINGTIGWFVLVMLVAITASLSPAQQAANLSIRAALAYE